MSPDPSYSENSERKSLSSFPYWLQGTHSQSLFSEISALLNLRRAHTAGYYKTVNQWTYKPVQRRCRTCCDHWWSAACSASLAERCNLGDRWAIDASWSDSGELFATSLAFTAKNSVKVVGQNAGANCPWLGGLPSPSLDYVWILVWDLVNTVFMPGALSFFLLHEYGESRVSSMPLVLRMTGIRYCFLSLSVFDLFFGKEYN